MRPLYKWDCILKMVIICGYFAKEKMNPKGEKAYVIDHQIT
jgi:hypothetical protein